MDKPFGLR